MKGGKKERGKSLSIFAVQNIVLHIKDMISAIYCQTTTFFSSIVYTIKYANDAHNLMFKYFKIRTVELSDLEGPVLHKFLYGILQFLFSWLLLKPQSDNHTVVQYTPFSETFCQVALLHLVIYLLQQAFNLSKLFRNLALLKHGSSLRPISLKS